MNEQQAKKFAKKMLQRKNSVRCHLIDNENGIPLTDDGLNRYTIFHHTIRNDMLFLRFCFYDISKVQAIEEWQYQVNAATAGETNLFFTI